MGPVVRARRLASPVSAVGLGEALSRMPSGSFCICISRSVPIEGENIPIPQSNALENAQSRIQLGPYVWNPPKHSIYISQMHISYFVLFHLLRNSIIDVPQLFLLHVYIQGRGLDNEGFRAADRMN